LPFFVLWGDIDPPQHPPQEDRLPVRNVLAAKQVFATRREAEASIRLMTETAASFGRPAPEFRIIEAATIGDAMSQVTGSSFTGP